MAQLLAAMISVAAMVAPSAGHDSPKLPDYPQAMLIDLHRAAEKSKDADGGSKSPIVVLGTVCQVDGRGEKSFVLAQPLDMCCPTRINVFINVRGGQGEPVKQGQWLAVYGRLRRVEIPAKATETPGRGLFDASLVIEAELIVPAERLMKRDDLMVVLQSPSLTYFLRAVRETGLADQLRVMDKITVLAPVDQAFEKLPKAELDALFKPDNRQRLRHLVLNHVIADQLLEADLNQRDQVTAVSKLELRIEHEDGTVRIGPTRTVFEDIRASNGMVHLVSDVILPPVDLVEMLKERRLRRLENEGERNSP